MKAKTKKNGIISTKEKILKTSILLIEKQGLDQFSLRKLAEKIKMDPMAVYHYFTSKEELIVTCLEFIFQDFCNPKKTNILETQGTSLEGKAKHNQTKEYDYFRLQTLLGHYRKKYLVHPNLCKFLLNHPNLIIKDIDAFNDMLIKEIQISVPNLVEAILIRDVLVDFIHGFGLAEISIAKKNKIQKLELESKFQKSIHFLIRKLLRS